MPYRLLQVSDLDPGELGRIDLAGISGHAAAVERIQRHSLGWSWCHQQAFRALGVDCTTIIPDCEAVRQLDPIAAAVDPRSPLSPAQAYVEAVTRAEQPDVLFLENATLLDQRAIERLRACPHPPLLVTHLCAALPRSAEATLARYDLVLCCSPYFQAWGKARGARVALYYHCAPQAALDLPPPPLESCLRRACFVGSIVAGSRYHGRRLHLLRQICGSGTPIDIYSDPPASRLLTALKARRGSPSRLAGALAGVERRLAARSPLHHALKPPVYGQAMFHTLQRHICAVNVHAGMAQGFAANMRLFEAAALGVCLISEDHPNLGDLFEPEREILTYRSGPELIERIRFCLAHPEEARAIGMRARARALLAHRHADRVAALEGWLRQLLRKPAP